jgi:hypothetical protein
VSESDGSPPLTNREDLRTEYRALLGPLSDAKRRDPAGRAISKGIWRLLEEDEQVPLERVQAAKLELMCRAYEAAHELQRSLSRLELRPWRQPLTRRTLALIKACIRMRHGLMAGIAETDGLAARLDAEVNWSGLGRLHAVERGRPGLLAGWWPSAVRRWQWHEHYNAACLYAIPLHPRFGAVPGLGSQARDGLRAKLARRAVSRLERATACAERDFVASRRDWVLEEDPDLAGLRREPEFKGFVARYFPTADPPATRPPVSQLMRQGRHVQDLLRAVAGGCHDVWHARRETAHLDDPHLLIEWWAAELELWKRVYGVARHAYDWRQRQRLAGWANDWLVRNGKPRVAVRFRGDEERSVPSAGAAPAGAVAPALPQPRVKERYAEAEGASARAAAERMLTLEHQGINARLERLADLLDETNVNSYRMDLERWIDALRRADTAREPLVSRAEAAALCQRAAAVWQALANWFELESRDPEARRAQMDGAVSRSAQLLRQVSGAGRWAPCRAVRRVAGRFR